MEALIYIFQSVVYFFAGIFLLRFFMQLFLVSFANPIGYFVKTLTEPLVTPVRRLLPASHKIDLSCLLFAYIVILIYWIVIYKFHLLLFAIAVIDLVACCIYLFQFVLIVYVIVSWVAPHSLLMAPLHQFTQVFLRPIRRILPPIGGIDLSPLIAIVLLGALNVLAKQMISNLLIKSYMP